MKNPNFNLDHQFNLYLKRVGLHGKPMPPVQYTELKRAFMGACGQMLILLRDDLAQLPDHEAMLQINDLLNQVSNFWLTTRSRQN